MSSSSTVRVEKATSDLLIAPDWTMNMDICDSINSQNWQAKDVVKAVKKRLQSKNPNVQLLSLTLLETMVKNCGDNVHFQIVERNILPEMIKIVRKKTNMHVRDKILVLLDSWQEAFGGPGGKHPQYYWAYEELRRSGVGFPQRSRDEAPIFSPPVTHPMLRHAHAVYGLPSNTSIKLDEAMTSEMENLSLSNLESMRSVKELLADMLQAVNPNNREAVKDEVIVDLVSRCHSNQEKLVRMLNSTGDEELLCQGLSLNDSLQSLLAKHDAIASGSPLPLEVRDSKPRSNSTPTAPIAVVTSRQLEEEEEEDDGFAQLARRHTKYSSSSSASTNIGIGEGAASLSRSSMMTATTAATPSAELASNPSSALALPAPPTPVRTTMKEQDMIDLLSTTLSTTPTAPHTPPSTSNQIMCQVPVSPTTQGYPYEPQTYPGNLGQVSYSNYVVPWAQIQPQLQPRPQFPHYSSSYPSPPWATAPAKSNQSPLSATNPYTFLSPHANASTSSMPMHVAIPLKTFNSIPGRDKNGSAVYREAQVSPTQQPASPATRHKPFIPSYRLFEDLNILGSADGGLKTTSRTSTSPSIAGMSGQGMVGGRK